MQMCSLHINGQVIPTQETFDVINPATGEVFAKCSLATEEHVDMAVKAARNAFPAWSARSDAERSALCLELAQTLEENMPEMMELVTQENGKPLVGLNNVGSGMEVGGSIAWIQATANTALP